MSNEQTVRHFMFKHENASLRLKGWHDGEGLLKGLGIDPDMSVSELQRRLRIAERVLESFIEITHPMEENWVMPADVCWADDLLAWLTREDDQ